MRITERQKKLLIAIVKEFIETAEAVPSEQLKDRYDLPISSATIRNEMKALCDAGFLKQLHTSSGRVPTTMGFRMFIKEMIDQVEQLEVLDQQRIRSKIFNNRFSKEEILNQALKSLVSLTENPALIVTSNKVHYAGLADMLDIPEFRSLEDLQILFRIIEDYTTLIKIFSRNKSNSSVKVLIGEEMGFRTLENFAIVFTDSTLFEREKCQVAVIGPNRMNYSTVIPSVRYVADQITKSTIGW